MKFSLIVFACLLAVACSAPVNQEESAKAKRGLAFSYGLHHSPLLATHSYHSYVAPAVVHHAPLIAHAPVIAHHPVAYHLPSYSYHHFK